MKISGFCFFLFLWLLRCFTSPGLPCMPMYSACNMLILINMSFLIRKSSDQRLFGTSPGLFAPYNVLLRSKVSRHPPYALIIYILRKHKIVLLLCNHLQLFFDLMLNCKVLTSILSHYSTR